MPQPDLLVARSLPDDDAVEVSDVLIAVEIASTTLRKDLGLKAELYAEADVGEYLVFDLYGGTIHQFSSPVSGAYQERQDVAFGCPLTSATIPHLTVATDELA